MIEAITGICWCSRIGIGVWFRPTFLKVQVLSPVPQIKYRTVGSKLFLIPVLLDYYILILINFLYRENKIMSREELNRIRDDLFCAFCGKQCKSLNSLNQHSTRCSQNPNRKDNAISHG